MFTFITARWRSIWEPGSIESPAEVLERGSVWRIAPPLTVSTGEIDQAVEILDRALRESLDELSASKAS